MANVPAPVFRAWDSIGEALNFELQNMTEKAAFFSGFKIVAETPEDLQRLQESLGGLVERARRPTKPTPVPGSNNKSLGEVACG